MAEIQVRNRSRILGGSVTLISLIVMIAKDMILGGIGDFLMALLPESTLDYISRVIIPYWAAIALLLLGIMAIIGWGANTTVHLSLPFFRRSSEDHWAHRRKMELMALANVASGRDPTAAPMSGEPENSYYHVLKEAVESGSLKAKRTGIQVDYGAEVEYGDFCRYTKTVEIPWIQELLARWSKGQQARNSDTDQQKTEPELGRDISLSDAIMRVAFKTWDWQPALTDTKTIDIEICVENSMQQIRQAAVDGLLPIWGNTGDTNIHKIAAQDFVKANIPLDLVLQAAVGEPDELNISNVSHDKLSYSSLMTNKAAVDRSFPIDHWAERKQLVPDWRICEAMDYIAAQFGNENEQDIDKKYLDPTRLLTAKARSGEIQIWGKRILGQSQAEIASREISANEWNNRELLVWACVPTALKAQTRDVGQDTAQQLTDLHVNEFQIKKIPWRKENIFGPFKQTEPRYDTPIHEAVAYVARRTGDNDADNFFEATRKTIRQAALNNEIKFRGRKELEGEQGHCDEVYTWIETSYWGTHILNEMATDRNYEAWEHNKARDLKKELHRNRYWGLRVSMDEIRRRWP